jgi:hypothetical protein
MHVQGRRSGRKLQAVTFQPKSAKQKLRSLLHQSIRRKKKKKRIFKISWDGRRPLQRGAVELNSLVKWSFL